MADYKVGSLQIVFNTLNQTDEGFKKLATNLRAVQKLIGNIANTDLKPFVANIKQITKSFSPLVANISGASGALKDFNEVTKRLGINKIADVAQGIQSISKATEDLGNAQDNIGYKISERQFTLAKGAQKAQKSIEELTIEEYRNVVASKQQQIAYLEATLALGKAGENVDKYKQDLVQLRKELEQMRSAYADSGEGAKKGASGLNKFFASVKRIAMYRLIRSALKAITSAFSEGVSSLANFDSGFNQTMSQITTSLTIIKTSLGSILMPILTAIAPVLQQIAVGFANLGNVINASMAKMQGLATYTKINTDKLLEYGKASKGVLLDFDKFRALGGQEDSILSSESIESLNEELGETNLNFQAIYFLLSSIGDLFGSVLKLIDKIAKSSAVQSIIGIISWVVGGLAKAVSWLIDILDKSGLIEPILWGIVAVLGYIAATKIITWLANGAIIKWIKAVISLLKEDFRGTLKLLGGDLVKVLTSTKALVAGIGALGGSLIYLASNWSQLTDKQKIWIPLASTLIALIVGIGTALVLSITAIKEALKLNPAAIAKAAITAALFTAAAGIAIGTAISTSKNSANTEVAKMADGGSPSIGSLFWAGEAGAEFVTVGRSGRTEVTNVYQMREAVEEGTYEALVRYNRTSSGGRSQPIVINVNGRPLFEAVRQEANKSGLDFKRA